MSPRVYNSIKSPASTPRSRFGDQVNLPDFGSAKMQTGSKGAVVDARNAKKSLIAAAAELAISGHADLESSEEDDAPERGRKGRPNLTDDGDMRMISAAWGAELPRAAKILTPRKVEDAHDEEYISHSSGRAGMGFRQGEGAGRGRETVEIPCIPMISPLKVPMIPLHLLSPPEKVSNDRERSTSQSPSLHISEPDLHVEKENERPGSWQEQIRRDPVLYSRRSAVQQSALLEAIGEDSVCRASSILV